VIINANSLHIPLVDKCVLLDTLINVFTFSPELLANSELLLLYHNEGRCTDDSKC